jgi:hypothetical protein
MSCSSHCICLKDWIQCLFTFRCIEHLPQLVGVGFPTLFEGLMIASIRKGLRSYQTLGFEAYRKPRCACLTVWVPSLARPLPWGGIWDGAWGSPLQAWLPTECSALSHVLSGSLALSMSLARLQAPQLWYPRQSASLFLWFLVVTWCRHPSPWISSGLLQRMIDQSFGEYF